jgi:hypothetical protein
MSIACERLDEAGADDDDDDDDDDDEADDDDGGDDGGAGVGVVDNEDDALGDEDEKSDEEDEIVNDDDVDDEDDDDDDNDDPCEARFVSLLLRGLRCLINDSSPRCPAPVCGPLPAGAEPSSLASRLCMKAMRALHSLEV